MHHYILKTNIFVLYKTSRYIGNRYNEYVEFVRECRKDLYGNQGLS